MEETNIIICQEKKQTLKKYQKNNRETKKFKFSNQ